MNPKQVKLFILSAGAILLAAALVRFLIAAGTAPVLAMAEPMLGISLRYAVLIVGGIELAVALVCLFGKKAPLQVALLAWLGTNYLVYEVGLYSVGLHPQNTGIGSLTDPLHLLRGATGLLIAFLPVYLVLGGYGAAIWLWMDSRSVAHSKEAAAYLKMHCPACGTHIKFNIENLGQTIACPQCQAALTLREPEATLKMSCFFCRGHIEFPNHALGQKISCPHCNKDITLKEPV